MSYEISIKSDDKYTARIDRRKLYEYISTLPNIVHSDADHFVFRDPNVGTYMEIDLELVSEEGDSLDIRVTQERNCVRIHIPYYFLESTGAQIYEICFQIADRIGWKVYDEQLGNYLSRNTT